MRHPKRFCVKCSKLQALTIRKHKRYKMYHCRSCGSEICRLGDGEQQRNRLSVPNLGTYTVPDDIQIETNLLDLACSNPDVLSDEHNLWIPEEESGNREEWGRIVTASFTLLTARQREIAEAVLKHRTHKKAADHLGISRPVVTKNLSTIQKKIGYIFDKSPLI